MAEPFTDSPSEQSPALIRPMRARSLPSHSSRTSSLSPKRSVSTPPETKTKTKTSLKLLGPAASSNNNVSSSETEQVCETAFPSDQNAEISDAEMLDAEIEDATSDPASNTTASQNIPPADHMQIDSVHKPEVQHLTEPLPATYNPPSSPEVPLLQTLRRAESPPLTILSVRAVRPTNAERLPLALPIRPQANNTCDVQCADNAAEAPSALIKTSSTEMLLGVGEQGPNGIHTPGKRPLSPTTETMKKKPRAINATVSVSANNQMSPDDGVEVVAARPVRGRPPTRRDAFRTTGQQQVEREASPTRVVPLAPLNPINEGSAHNWAPTEYAALAQACFFSFPFEEFQERRNKTRQEVREVFAAIIEAPLLSRTNLGDQRVNERRKLQREVSTMHQQYRELCDRDMQREREQMRQTVEAEVWHRMSLEGWVKLEEAKSVLTEKERQVEEANTRAQQQQALRGPGRRGARVMSVEEATEELQAASAELEKAKKAEQRKAKRIEKKETQGGGPGRYSKKGKFDDDTPSKPGPKPGYGKGKGF